MGKFSLKRCGLFFFPAMGAQGAFEKKKVFNIRVLLNIRMETHFEKKMKIS